MHQFRYKAILWWRQFGIFAKRWHSHPQKSSFFKIKRRKEEENKFGMWAEFMSGFWQGAQRRLAIIPAYRSVFYDLWRGITTYFGVVSTVHTRKKTSAIFLDVELFSPLHGGITALFFEPKKHLRTSEWERMAEEIFECRHINLTMGFFKFPKV